MPSPEMRQAMVTAPLGDDVFGDDPTTNRLMAVADSHAFYYETAGAAAVCGVQIRPVATQAGIMSPQQVAENVRPRDDPHQPITAAITFENTHNRHGGIVWPLADLRAAGDA